MDGALRNNLARPVPWLLSFSIDSGSIDDDHRRLIDLCNELCTAASSDPARARNCMLSWDVPNLMYSHFTNEEWLLAEIDFPGAAGHRHEHDKLRRILDNLHNAPSEYQFAAALNDTRTDLVEHIIRHDLIFKSRLLNREGR